MKLLSFYPVVLIGGFLLLIARVLGWSSLAAFVLIGVFKLAGTLEVSGWIVAALLAAGVATLILSELFVELLVRLKLGEGHYFLSVRH